MLFIKIFGIVYAGLGVLFLVNPESLRRYIGFWREGKRIYTGALCALAFAVVFLWLGPQCRWPWVPIALGLLALIKGVSLFLLGPQKIIPILDWYQKKSSAILRLMGLVAFALGGLLFYAA